MLTLSEAAIIAKRNPATIRKAIVGGHLKARKYGKMWFVEKRDLIQWIDNPERHIRGVKAKQP